MGLQSNPPIVHTVTTGETLYSIAQVYHKTVIELQQLNGFTSTSIIANQQLIVGYEPESINGNPLAKKASTYDRLVSSILTLKQKTLDGKSQKEPTKSSSVLPHLSALFQAQPIREEKFRLQNKVLVEQLTQLNNDFGIKTTTSYTNNFEPGVFEAEQPFYTSRISTGLSIELLSGGILGNKRKARGLENEISINNLLERKSTKQENYSFHYNHLIYSFNLAKESLLIDRIAMIEEFLKIASKLVYVRSISWEEVLQLKSELAAQYKALERIQNYNQAFKRINESVALEPINAITLPVLNISLDKLYNSSLTDSLNKKILAIESEQLANEFNQNRDLRLKAEVGYNAIAGGSQGGTRTYASFGLSFTAPLFKNSRDKKIQKAKLNIKSSARNREVRTIQNELTNLYYEYQYGIKQYIAFEGKTAVIQEKLRKDANSQFLGNEETKSIATLKRLNELKAVELEMVEIKQVLYLNLLKMFSLSDVSTITDFTTPRTHPFSTKKNKDQRSIYLWSNTMREIGGNFLLKYLVNNQIDRVMLSSGIEKDTSDTFLKEASIEGMSVFKLIGENSYITKGFTSSLKASIESLNILYDGVHLDIEPQALPGWEENKMVYTKSLIELLMKAKGSLSPDKKLSVSVPSFLPASLLEELFNVADEVVIMVYGKTTIDFIQRKIIEEMSVSQPEKLTIALRASDFNDRIQLEELIADLMAKTLIKRFVIQDLGDMITLDQNTILGDLNQVK